MSGGNDFQGKAIVVSGASSGIGRAVVRELAGRGARVIAVGRSRATIEAACAGIPDVGFLELDLARHDEIVPAVRALVAQHGRLYGLCHSAGVVDTVGLAACTPERSRAIMDVNYVAGLELARGVCRRDVMEPEGGAVLMISSIYAHVGGAGEILYSGSKGAVRAAARSMAVELARRGIRVNVLSPGMVRTPMTDHALGKLSAEQVARLEEAHPLGFGAPEDVAHAAAFLLAPASRWITGADLVVDGGRTAH